MTFETYKMYNVRQILGKRSIWKLNHDDDFEKIRDVLPN